MVLQYDGATRINNTGGTDYLVDYRFQDVLDTLPDSSVPRSVALLGIITFQLTPVDEDPTGHRKKAIAVTEPPKADIPPETTQSISWLIEELDELLDDERKKEVDSLIVNARLHWSESGKDTSNSSNEDEKLNNNDEERSVTNTSDSNEKDAEVEDNGVEYKCEFCSRPFSAESELVTHLRSCSKRSEGAVFDCESCENTYYSQHELDKHAKTSHNNQSTSDRKNICSDCGREFESSLELVNHRSTHTGRLTKSRNTLTSENQKSSNRGVVSKNDVGNVAHFDREDHYGFIATSEVADDVFFHASNFVGEFPEEGDTVQYNIRGTESGYEAVKIKHYQREEESEDGFASTRTRWGTD